MSVESQCVSANVDETAVENDGRTCLPRGSIKGFGPSKCCITSANNLHTIPSKQSDNISRPARSSPWIVNSSIKQQGCTKGFLCHTYTNTLIPSYALSYELAYLPPSTSCSLASTYQLTCIARHRLPTSIAIFVLDRYDLHRRDTRCHG